MRRLCNRQVEWVSPQTIRPLSRPHPVMCMHTTRMIGATVTTSAATLCKRRGMVNPIH